MTADLQTTPGPPAPPEPIPAAAEAAPPPGPAPGRRRRRQTRVLFGALGLAVAAYGLMNAWIALGLEFPRAPRSAADARMVASAKSHGGSAMSPGTAPGWRGWAEPEEIAVSFVGPYGPGDTSRLPLTDDALIAFIADAGRGPVALQLTNSNVGGRGLRALGRLDRLWSLFVDCQHRRPDPDGDGVSEPMVAVAAGDLAPICGRGTLKMLHLTGVGIAPDAFRGLPPALPTWSIHLHRSDVPVEALADLPAAFPGLTDLGLDNCGLDDAGLARVGAIRSLDSLSIRSNTAITPAGVAALAGLRGLRNLDATDTRLSAADLAPLRAAIPGLRVYLGNGRVLEPGMPPP